MDPRRLVAAVGLVHAKIFHTMNGFLHSDSSAVPGAFLFEPSPPFSRNGMMRGTFRESLAELWGTFILIAFGCGVNTVVAFGDEKSGDWLSINFGWFLGVTLGIYASAGVSGAHLNPAVTVALALFRDFSWRKVIPYILAQVAGAFLGAALVFGVYYETFQKVRSRSETRLRRPAFSALTHCLMFRASRADWSIKSWERPFCWPWYWRLATSETWGPSLGSRRCSSG